MASIVTTATGGTITLSTNVESGGVDTGPAPWENPRDGLTYSTGFETSDLYKGIRLRSTATLVTPWYRISGITNTMVATVTEWDQAVSGSDFAEGHTLRGLYGGDGRIFEKNGTGDVRSFENFSALGWEIRFSCLWCHYSDRDLCSIKKIVFEIRRDFFCSTLLSHTHFCFL